MVLPIYLAVRFFMALVAGVNVNLLHVARGVVRRFSTSQTPRQVSSIECASTLLLHTSAWALASANPYSFNTRNWLRQHTPRPTRTSPGTPSTSAGRRIDVKPTATPVTPSTPAPEATCFDLAERAPVASAKQWCPSSETIAAVIEYIHSALAFCALTYLPKLIVLAYTVCAYLV